ncbi:armadillo-type fold, CLASP N-terminal domain protein [Artemisia annua]|uniref:Armadillo-type fold, CLASP N-terminal domain protein n=1 Tax=Artemisia annua TaxID=35608 RepID=A0A2U1PM35_ARTAN|nr:armadillo-type fold, CLASP N-terminal domain protein [Artemisia annua]
MEEALEMARAKDTKERLAGVERLHELLEASRKSLTSSEVTALVDTCLDLLKDNNNFRVSQGGLMALDSAAVLSGEHLKLHFNALVPATVERLGDSVLDMTGYNSNFNTFYRRSSGYSSTEGAKAFLFNGHQNIILKSLLACPLVVVQVSSPTLIVERAGSNAWTHKSWRVREEFAKTVTAAIGLFASTELPLQRAILPPAFSLIVLTCKKHTNAYTLPLSSSHEQILQMLYDPNPGVREAAILCIEEMYAQIGPQFREELLRHQLPSSLVILSGLTFLFISFTFISTFRISCNLACVLFATKMGVYSRANADYISI